MSNLIPEVRADVNGKLVTRHVKATAAAPAKKLPSPTLGAPATAPRKRRAFKPSEDQLTKGRYGIPMETSSDAMWGNLANRPTSPELLAVPMTKEQLDRFEGHYHRFDATQVEYYSVMSVARPWDAINLLHRGCRSAEDARSFLTDNGLDHLIGDHSAYVEELLRKRITPNMAASYLDKIIDHGGDPEHAAAWVESAAMKSIQDKTEVLSEEMLSGAVTISDLKYIGLKQAAVSMKAVGQAIAHCKADNNPDFTMDDIRNLAKMEYEASQMNKRNSFNINAESTLAAKLNLCRFYGFKAADRWVHERAYEWKKGAMAGAGATNDHELADYTLYASKLGVGWFHEDYYTAIDKVMKSEADPEVVRNMVYDGNRQMEAAVRIMNAAAESIAPAVSSGWL